MYQAIPENFSQILLKRLFVFIAAFVIVMIIIYFNQSLLFTSGPSVNSADNFLEINKTNVFFNS
jgi:hypothetical protein